LIKRTKLYGRVIAPETGPLDYPLLCCMANNLTVKELAVLQSLVDHGVLSMTQLAILQFPSRQMARLKARYFYDAGLVEILHQDFSGGRGKPEGIIFPTEKAIKILNNSELAIGKKGIILPAINLRNLNHQLLINWVRIHLTSMEKQIPQLSVKFLSPFVEIDAYRIDIVDSKRGNFLIPDGIFSISYTPQQKSLLFFLEADMGTETLTSQNPSRNDFRRKILEYQHIFQNQLYKRFESIFGCQFNGFRTLVVADSKGRHSQLCRLVKSMKSTGFIWLTDKDSIFTNGISDLIWFKGGDIEAGPFSIIGPTLTVKNLIEIPK
jgi:hypothetical protein